MKLTIDKMVRMSSMASIVVVLEKVLEFIPNVQLTVVLLMVFIYYLTLPESLLLVTVYTFLDILLGGISLYAVPMFIAWSLFAVIVHYSKGHMNKLILIGIFYPIVYSVMLGIPYVLMLDMDIRAYFIADIPYTLVFIGANILTIYYLYPVITKTLENYMGEKHENLH